MAEHPRLVALLVDPAAAEEARAARGVEGAEHAVAHVQPHRVALRHDGADVLVADDEPGLDLDPPVVDVEVRPADAGRIDLHHRVVGCDRLGIGALLERHAAWLLEGHGEHGGLL